MENQKRKPLVNWILFLVTVAVVFTAGIFTASIMERRAEKAARLQIVREIPEWEPRNEVWGENFPKEWESYYKTLDTNFSSAHGGSATIDYLAEFPELVILWAGYPFSIEYNQGRGHAHAVKDVRKILRTGGVENSPMPATCWTCKSTDVPRMMNTVGVENFYNKKWIEWGEEIINPIGCQDCHDPKSMKLRITRPALVEAFERQGKKMNEFSNQDMRSLVCAQCHVEYYFKKENKYLVFPWDNGFSADDMEKYYDSLEFSDWTHKLSRTPMLKAQHPDYELYKTGVHASRNVACADCHMPYKIEGGVKFTDHHIASPLQNMANACQTCHRESEENLRADVYSRQDKVIEIRRIAEKALAAAHIEAKTAWDAGASEEDMAPVLKNIRHAQWRWDWVAAANGVGFHSPVEALRVLGTSIEKAEKARGMINVILTKLGKQIPVQLPDISSKEKAQAYIGIDLEKERADKMQLLETVVKGWDDNAQKRQGTMQKY
ncbi:MAG: ammonia-forming cytochrome c nitrite reductase [Candidatus Kapabacteria bacterium]|jgi:nitrite reductase (cytochrome c-552)|nr:ammonia-forming cytochrome c nitrite reductase [Candidatus Kapabacteria bacterium]